MEFKLLFSSQHISIYINTQCGLLSIERPMRRTLGHFIMRFLGNYYSSHMFRVVVWIFPNLRVAMGRSWGDRPLSQYEIRQNVDRQ